MAELELTEGKAGGGCCSATAQETCCEPEAEDECCGSSHADGCGCPAGMTRGRRTEN